MIKLSICIEMVFTDSPFLERLERVKGVGLTAFEFWGWRNKNIDEIEAKLFVVKEQFGAGSSNVGIKLGKLDALEHAKRIKHPIFQPYIGETVL